MTRVEYDNYIVKQNVDISKLNIVIGEKKEIPYITGGFQEDGVWKLYMVGERQEIDIVQQGTEEEIFDLMYSITESRRKRNNI